MTSYTASWEGAIRTEVYRRNDIEEDWVNVTMVPWKGSGCHVTLYDGPVGRFDPEVGVCADAVEAGVKVDVPTSK